jgi:threonine 3-dehydrogenase
VEVGKNVTGYQVGDRISVETHIPCNHCFQCENGRRHICENMKLFGVTEPGAFAEYTPVPQDCIVRLGDGITYEMGAMLEAMGAGVHGVEKAEVRGKTVLVSGCGPIGLMVAGACKAHGAKRVIACDILPEKLRLAEAMGADTTINSMETDIVQAVRRETNGAGADAAIDITGNGKAIVAGLRALRKGGRLVSVGLPNGEIPINLTEDIIYRESQYTGVSGRQMFATWDDCMKILQSPGFSLEPVMGGQYPLDGFEEALAAIQGGAPGKMLLIP